VVLEDSLTGMQAGLAAGMRVILVPDMVKPKHIRPPLRWRYVRICTRRWSLKRSHPG
jgi:beta-phosphoglucomutase-like phosphatase (HAD superfamily)